MKHNNNKITKHMKSRILFGSALAAICLIATAFIGSPQQPAPWPVPDNYKTMKNTVTYDKTVAAALYSMHCKSCHGKEGLGDGPKAAQLDTPSGDLSSEAFQKQSDGALFYKTLKGRDDMPGFEKKIPDPEDTWQLVHYMRTFAE